MSSNYTIPQEHGILVVFSGPSGAGKGTILKRYFEDTPPAVLSVSATTRPPRPGEVDGVHYHFVTRAEFERMIAENGVLEYNVYNPRPHRRGTAQGPRRHSGDRNQRRRPHPPDVPQRPFHLCAAPHL